MLTKSIQLRNAALNVRSFKSIQWIAPQSIHSARSSVWASKSRCTIKSSRIFPRNMQIYVQFSSIEFNFLTVFCRFFHSLSTQFQCCLLCFGPFECLFSSSQRKSPYPIVNSTRAHIYSDSHNNNKNILFDHFSMRLNATANQKWLQTIICYSLDNVQGAPIHRIV